VGSVFVNTFTDNGTWSYRCRLHSGMTGSVQVSAAGVDSPSVTISNNQFTPASVHVKTGSYVKWTLSQGTHTVSRP
jgi:plastocyanin